MKRSTSVVLRLGILILVLFFVGVGVLLWWDDAISSVNGNNSETVIFEVQPGEGVKSIASNLSEKSLIRSPTAFYLLVKLMGIERELQAGDFRLNSSMDARTIALELTHGILDVWVTTLEGWRVEEVANRLAKDLDIPEQEFLRHAREGYMFPDTYLIPREATAGAIAEIFMNNFENKVTDQMRIDAQSQGLTIEEVVILASIVEREGHTDEDRPYIAGILRRRLDEAWPIQADATVQYALGYQAVEKSWWKKALTLDDLEVNSVFNSYTNNGLPPQPISNPGLSAIRAVIYPKNSDYMFYIHDPSGTAHYGRTLEEHNANISRYLR